MELNGAALTNAQILTLRAALCGFAMTLQESEEELGEPWFSIYSQNLGPLMRIAGIEPIQKESEVWKNERKF